MMNVFMARSGLLGCWDRVRDPTHKEGGLSNKYCWGQRQTVVEISASFQRLALSSQLTLTVNQRASQPTQTQSSPPHPPSCSKTQTSDYFQLHCVIEFHQSELTDMFHLLFVVSVSSEPKEPGAAVVAPGRSSAQPAV